MKVLVTGGSGAVGRYVVDDLLAHGHRVGVLDLQASHRQEVAHHKVDVLALPAVQDVVGGYEVVVHVAGIPHPLNDPAKLDDAIKGLEEFRRKNGDFYRFYDAFNYLGQLHAAKKDSVKAKLAFEALGKAPWKDYQMTARIALGRLAFDEKKIDEAASEYDAVVGMQADGPAEESLRQEAVLGKARAELLIETIWNIERATDVRQLRRLLHAG